MSDSMFRGSDPVDVPIRPLNKGMWVDWPADQLPEGVLRRALGYDVHPRGLQRRDAWNNYAGGPSLDTDAGEFVDFAPVWKTDGTQYNALLTDKYLYEAGVATITRKDWPYSTGTVSVGGTTVKASAGSMWSSGNNLRAGDMIALSTEVREITDLTQISTLTIDTAFAGTWSTGSAYVIRRSFNDDEPDVSLDHATIDNKLVVSDHARTMYVYNGTSLSNYLTTGHYVPGCVTFFKDRLWIGNTIESGLYYRQRIRWSSVSGNPRPWPTAGWLDLPYTPGKVLRLVPMGNLLIAYFNDAIYYGVPTNLTNLPYQFNRIQTAAIGLCGPHAVCETNAGHFFVATDNIYFLPTDPREGPQAIGDPILSESIDLCSDFYGVYVAQDPKRRRVLFAFPTEDDRGDIIWAYNLVTKAWSEEDRNFEMIANPLLDFNLTYNDLSTYAATYNDLSTAFPTYDDMRVDDPSSKSVFLGFERKIYELRDGQTQDDLLPGTITSQIQTGELDLDHPNLDKTYLRLSLRLLERPSAALSFAVASSDDGGNSWSSLGTLTIGTTKREGYVNFAKTGSAVRFRLTCSSAAQPYVVTGIVVRVAPRGREVLVD